MQQTILYTVIYVMDFIVGLIFAVGMIYTVNKAVKKYVKIKDDAIYCFIRYTVLVLIGMVMYNSIPDVFLIDFIAIGNIFIFSSYFYWIALAVIAIHAILVGLGFNIEVVHKDKAND